MTAIIKREGSSTRERSGKGPRVGHLDSLTGILKEMGNVYREMRYGHTPASDGSRLIFCLKCMRDVIETMSIERIEKRLDEMEGRVHLGDQTNDRPAMRPH
jgi:hypothetical protein